MLISYWSVIVMCGCRKHFHTQQTIFSLKERWKNTLGQNGCDAILTDLSKAFDAINHYIWIPLSAK